jgi:uncharacterized lipoprotein YbaY
VETVTILRELWRRRFLVAIVALVAIFVGLALTYRFSLPPESRKYEVGLANSRVLVDTPASQVVQVDPRGSETLGTRASLIAALMVEGEVKAAIAERAGLPPKRLVAVSQADIDSGSVPSSTLNDPDVNLLTTQVFASPEGDQLPIVEIEAQTPTVAGAANLAGAAASGLRDYLDSKAAAENATDRRRLRVAPLGAPQARLEVRGPSRVIAVGSALFILVAGCAAIVGGSALARGWREAAASEHGEPDDLRLDLPPLSLVDRPGRDGKREPGVRAKSA